MLSFTTNERDHIKFEFATHMNLPPTLIRQNNAVPNYIWGPTTKQQTLNQHLFLRKNDYYAGMASCTLGVLGSVGSLFA